MILDKLLVASIFGIALDEFNVPFGAVTLKFSLATALLSLLFIDYTKRFRSSLFLSSVIIFIIVHLVTLININAGISAVTHSISNVAANPYSRLFGLILLIVWSHIISFRLTVDKLQLAYMVFFALMVVKSLYIYYLYLSGSYDQIWWESSGLPRFSLTRGGMTANQMGAIWLVLLIVFAVLTFEFRRIGLITFWLILAPLVFLFGFMSGSRSFLVGVVILCFSLAFTPKRLGALVFFIIIFVIASYVYIESEFARLADDSALSRFDFWAVSLENISKNPLFGSGLGSDSVPHNTILQLWSETGLAGLIAFLIVLATLINSSNRINYRIIFLMFSPYLFFLMVDIGLMQWQTWALLGTALALARAPIILPVPRDCSRNVLKYV